jgi:hypothetical protein
MLLVTVVAEAQNLATLQGYIKDETGGVLPGVTVEIRNVDTGVIRNVITDGTGWYTSPALLPGNYQITASLAGFQTIIRENIILLVGQTLDVNITMGVASVEETITVTAESPVVELSRSSTAAYVSEEEIMNLPIAGRDFTDFALLQPTVRTDTIRGGISLSGQKGISSGVKIDGTEAKSAFFGYGRGGEATENDGVVIAQDTVEEFQVVGSGYAPEYGSNGGGYLNVITKSGTNTFRGNAFMLFRNDSMTADLKQTPLQVSRGNTESIPANEFKRYNWGATVGGPIVTDKTHFFAAYDGISRTDPFLDNIVGRGQYDAVLSRFPSLLRGYEPNNDGIAAPDPVQGRTATGRFTRDFKNTVLFGKINHQFNDRHSLSVRYNYTDYERKSDRKSEESLKAQTTNSFVASVVSLIGTNMVNEFRFQYATDNLDRLSNLESGDIVANFRIETPQFEDFGKPDFLPIFVREKKFQFQNNLSYSFGNHDLKFGADIQIDDLSEFFAGSYDGRYDFRTIDDFLANNDRRVRIWFADIDPPPTVNFEAKQTITGLFAQDSWRPNDRLTVNYGIRWDGTFNPSGIEHAFEEGREIPDDLNNWAPRAGFAYSMDEAGKSVLRGGFGLFYDRTPTLIFFDVVQSNGLPPNYGRIVVSPGQPGHVPLGEDIDHANAPPGLKPTVGIVDPDFQDAQTWRFNLGYEREVAPDWAAAFDMVYARSGNLQSSYDINVFEPSLNELGQYVYPSGRPNDDYLNIGTRNDISRSDFISGTFKLTKRYSRGYQLNAHYTIARDRDNDSNERSATSITLTNYLDPDYDFGLSERDTRHRLVFSGLYTLPLEILLSGIMTFQSGSVYNALDPDRGIVGHPTTTLRARANIDGSLSERNAFRGPSYKNVDLRVNKFFDVGRTRIEAIFEIFNLFNWGNFRVSGTGDYYVAPGSPVVDPEFGIADSYAQGPTFGNDRQFQIGIRVQY